METVPNTTQIRLSVEDKPNKQQLRNYKLPKNVALKLSCVSHFLYLFLYLILNCLFTIQGVKLTTSLTTDLVRIPSIQKQ